MFAIETIEGFVINCNYRREIETGVPPREYASVFFVCCTAKYQQRERETQRERPLELNAMSLVLENILKKERERKKGRKKKRKEEYEEPKDYKKKIAASKDSNAGSYRSLIVR